MFWFILIFKTPKNILEKVENKMQNKSHWLIEKVANWPLDGAEQLQCMNLYERSFQIEGLMIPCNDVGRKESDAPSAKHHSWSFSHQAKCDVKELYLLQIPSQVSVSLKPLNHVAEKQQM